ncbi:MAG: potassium channel family protein [Bacteroidales bacterium]|nr:potassium channel family protein [Bacteroidales bacterium]
MFAEFNNFKIKVRPEPFKTSQGIQYDATVCISFFDGNGKEKAYCELAYCEAEDIYKSIDKGEPVILDDCYIENFSLAEYRRSRGLAEKEPVTLNNFSARSAYFDARIASDFSNAVFAGEGTSFHGARFISGRTSFEQAVFTAGDKDFTDVVFRNGEVDFSNAFFNGGGIDFRGTRFFDGLKNFQYTDFGEGNVSFMDTQFGAGEVNFINTNFGTGRISFKGARFEDGKIDFQFARFGDGDISFERTEFGDGKTDFRKVEFGTGKINFNRASFGEGDVTFEASQLDDSRMTFKKTDFGDGNLFFEEVEYKTSELLFDNAQFGSGSIYFGKAWIKKLSMVSCHLDKYTDFRVSYCESMDLSDTIARDIIDFSSYEHKVEIGSLNLAGMRLVGQIYIDWHENQVKNIIHNQEGTSHHEKAEQFRILKENYGQIGNYKSEDLAYIQFKRHEQKADLISALAKSKWSAIWQLPLYGFKFLVIDRMGLYATSPARVIFSLLIIYFSFSLLHLVCPFFMDTAINCIEADTLFLDKLLNTLYYSLITFTTVGYGDCTPTGFLRAVAAIEGFVGPFMMSYFTVAFARKILR